MADETNTTENVAATPVDAAVAVPKKQRAPRRVKAVSDTAAVAAPAKTEKVVKERKKRASKAVPSGLPAAEKSAAVSSRKGRATTRTANAVVQSAPVSAVDEMKELLQLEEENKRLRHTLAEKLRAENADLRKRLGLA